MAPGKSDPHLQGSSSGGGSWEVGVWEGGLDDMLREGNAFSACLVCLLP